MGAWKMEDINAAGMPPMQRSWGGHTQLKYPFPQCLGWSHRQLPPKPIGPIPPTNPDHNQPHLAITCNPKRFSICSPQWTVRLQQCYYSSLRWDATPRYTRRRTIVAYGHSIQLMNGSSPWINSLTAMVSYMRLFFFWAFNELNKFSIFCPLSTFDS
jgi:hypothetical protein